MTADWYSALPPHHSSCNLYINSVLVRMPVQLYVLVDGVLVHFLTSSFFVLVLPTGTSTGIFSSTFLEGRSAPSCFVLRVPEFSVVHFLRDVQICPVPPCFVLIHGVQTRNPRKSNTTWTAAYFPINSRNCSPGY